MKRILTLTLPVLILFSFFACTESNETTDEKTVITVTSRKTEESGSKDTDWAEAVIADLTVKPGNDGFVMSNDVAVNHNTSTDATIKVDGVDETEKLTLEVGGNETEGWTLKATITAAEGKSLPEHAGKWTLTLKDTLTFTYTDGSSNTVNVEASADIDYTRTLYANGEEEPGTETATELTLKPRNSDLGKSTLTNMGIATFQTGDSSSYIFDTDSGTNIPTVRFTGTVAAGTEARDVDDLDEDVCTFTVSGDGTTLKLDVNTSGLDLDDCWTSGQTMTFTINGSFEFSKTESEQTIVIAKAKATKLMYNAIYND